MKRLGKSFLVKIKERDGKINNLEADRSWWVAWTSNPVCAVVILRWVGSIPTRFRQ